MLSLMRRNNAQVMTSTHHATLDALRNEDGNVENKSLKKNPRSRRHLKLVEKADVIIARAPVEPWICDEGDRKGTNWRQMQDHAERTGHHSYSKR